MDSIIGITQQNWFTLLKDNHYAIAPKSILKALYITLLSKLTSKDQKKEIADFQKQIEETVITEPPLFILGHWRSGTTFLHNVLCRDTQFAYPNLFETRNPHTFLTREPLFVAKLAKMKQNKRPNDNVVVSIGSPSEEEFAIGVMSLMSPLFAWTFPKRKSYYERYLTFDQVDKADVEAWQKITLHYLKKLTFKYKKPLLLKSPVNTARIRLFLELFPNAKFIHIHRHPYAVFRSAKKMFHTAFTTSTLQKNGSFADDDYVINHYKLMYDAYFRDVQAIPSDHFIDIAFEDLERDTFGEIKKIYNMLNLSGFERAQEAIKQYIDSLKGYKKNTYKNLNDALRDKIYSNWKRNFELWGYRQ